MKVLDVGCGTHKVKGAIGIDTDYKSDADFFMDCHDLHIFKDKSFDKAVFKETLEHLRHPYKALAEVYRVLKDEGVLTITIPNPNHWTKIQYYLKDKAIYQSKDHLYTWNRSEIQNLLSRVGFRINRIDYVTLPHYHSVSHFASVLKHLTNKSMRIRAVKE